VNQAVSRCDDKPPRDLRTGAADGFGNAAGSLSDQLEIAKRCIVVKAVAGESARVEALRLLHHPLTEANHVVDIEAPLT
jgi:hypothetical protein